MAVANKVDSNTTGLRFAEEASLKTLPASPVWHPLEPNSYDDFGGQTAKTARNPINAGRQRQKGVTTDLDASGGLEQDLTQTNMQRLLQGYFFADFREKADTQPFNGTEVTITNVDGTVETYDAASGLDVFNATDIIFASGFNEAQNNGLKTVSAVTATDVTVNEDLLDEAAPPSDARLVKVGTQFATGTVDVDVSGSLPVLDFLAGADPDDLGVIPGEFIFIGGDTASTKFANSENNGWARVKSVTGGDAGSITLDKTQDTMVAETGTGLDIQIFVGRVLKNESDPANQKRRSYQIERTLGSPDDANSQTQAEYLVGAFGSELSFSFQTADKVTTSLSFVALDNEQVTQSEDVKGGDRPDLVSGDAYNTSNDFSRLKMALLDSADSNPSKLFGFVTEFEVPINNNLSPNKAISVLGAFDVTAGNFTVDGSVTAYFSTVEAVKAVRDNSDVTLDFALAKDNVGVAVDIPLISLGDGRLNVEQDQPITLPLELGAAADRVFNHTLLMSFYDYLPDAAEA